MILFDANQPEELQRAEDVGADILRACVEMGGVLTGEHGVGVEKRDLMGIQFTADDLKQQQRLKLRLMMGICSILEKSFRNCIVAPNWGGFTSIRANAVSWYSQILTA